MKNLVLLTLFGVGLLAAPPAHAQPVVFGVGVRVGPVYAGVPPVCPYGYYGYYPYACAPYGYYGPEWFSGGIFIGAGPWFHGFRVHPGYWSRPGFYGRAGLYAHPRYYGRAPVARGPVGGYHGGYAARGAFRGAHR